LSGKPTIRPSDEKGVFVTNPSESPKLKLDERFALISTLEYVPGDCFPIELLQQVLKRKLMRDNQLPHGEAFFCRRFQRPSRGQNLAQ
jgi:hypothetical protein